MRVTPTTLPDVLLLEPPVFRDARGVFLETYHAERYQGYGVTERFVQDNISWSEPGVLRGLHLQRGAHAQGKLVQVLVGEVWDVAVDVRPDSPTFGQWVGEFLSAENARQLYIPPGFAHGFVVLSKRSLFVYKCTQVYQKASELAIRWNDEDLAIQWPITNPLVSEKDAAGLSLKEALPLLRG